MHSLVPYETPWIKIRLWGTKTTHGAGAWCAFPTTWREEWGNHRAKAKGGLVHHRGSERKAEEEEADTGGCAWGLWPTFSIWFNPKSKVAFWRVHCLHKPISTHGLWKNSAGGKRNWTLGMAAPKSHVHGCQMPALATGGSQHVSSSHVSLKDGAVRGLQLWRWETGAWALPLGLWMCCQTHECSVVL